MRETFVNGVASTLDGAINDTVTTVTVADGSVFPSSGEYRVLVGSEIMAVKSRSTNDLTVVRGAEGTTAASHLDTDAITAILTAGAIESVVAQADVIGTVASGGGSARVPYRLLDASGATLTASDFTWVNQDSSSVLDDPWGGFTVTTAETSGDWKLLHKSAPAAPYVLTVNAMFGPGLVNSTAGSTMGFGWRESSTGKFIVEGCELGQEFNGWRFTNPSTFAGTTSTNLDDDFFLSDVWFRVEDDNTDLRISLSADGMSWYECAVHGRTAFFGGTGPDQLCWAWRADAGEADRLMHLRAWVEE